jgi:hypothetical protein
MDSASQTIFANNLSFDTWFTTPLWNQDGTISSCISIRKEIWCNVGNQFPQVGNVLQFPVFFVFNYLDRSKACGPDRGCLVSSEPYFDFNEALAIAKEHEAEALASGKWFRLEDLKNEMR